MARLSLLVVALGLSAACDGDAVAPGGGDGGADGGGPDAFFPVDGAPLADARADCPVPMVFGTPSPAGATAVKAADGSITFSLTMDSGIGVPDRFDMKLVAGRGVFIDGPVVGQYTISGAQEDYDTCALCLLVEADNGEHYLAQSGLVQLDAVAGNLKGSLVDVRFAHASLEPTPNAPTTIIEDGCETRISSLAFDVAITGP